MSTYTLGVVVDQVRRIETTVQQLEQAMRHVSPASTDALRREKEQLLKILKVIMDSGVTSNVSIEALLENHKQCIQGCIDPRYGGEKSYIGRTRRV